MAPAQSLSRSQIIEELDRIPSEFHPSLLTLLVAFRESVTLPGAEESFRQGWNEAKSGQLKPASHLWDDIDAV